MGPCKHKHREADTWSRQALKQTRDESVGCQVMHKVAAIFPQKMNVCMCMYACSYKPICAASGTATRPGGGGLGDAFLRTLTPFDPAQPKKKKWKNVERVIADWQTDTVEGKSTVWQTAEAVGESDSDGGRERKTKRQTEIRQMEWDTDTDWPRPCLHQKCLCVRV